MYHHVTGVWLICAEWQRCQASAVKGDTSNWCHPEPVHKHPVPSPCAQDSWDTRICYVCTRRQQGAHAVTHFTHTHIKSTEVAIKSQNEASGLVPFCIFLHFSILLKFPLLFQCELMKKLLQISLLTFNTTAVSHNWEVFYYAGFFSFIETRKQILKNESDFINREQTAFLGWLLVVWRRIFWLWPFLPIYS